MLRKLATIALSLCATVGFAEVVTIEGFENTEDPANWQFNVTPTHTHNVAVNGLVVPQYVTTNVTEGALAGKFVTHWAETSGTATANPYEPGETLLYWGVRFNVNAPSSLPNNVINTVDGVLEADIANESAYPIQIAIVVDTENDSDLERGPLVTVDANSTATYTWDFSTLAPIGFDTGDGVIIGDARLKSLLVYTTVAPTASELSITLDNIRNVNSDDVVAPAVPQPLSLTQVSGSSDVMLRWAPSGDPTLTAYNIYVSDDTNFNTVPNRLTFPDAPEATVAGTEQSYLLTGLPSGQNTYVSLTALDDATTANESAKSQVLAINPADTGSLPSDRLVLDNDEFAPGDAEFVANGYFHAAVYTAQALQGLGRSFDTVTAEAVMTGEVTITPKVAGVVVWSNLMDGSAVLNGSISLANLVKIQTFIDAGGNIIVSGSAVAQDVDAAHSGLETYLKATLVTDNIGIADVDPAGVLAAVPDLSTSLNPGTNPVAFATTANDGMLSANGSIRLAEYDGIPVSSAVAGVGYDDSLVFLGFAFESAGNGAQPAASGALRQVLMGEMVEYLIGETAETAASDWQLFN